MKSTHCSDLPSNNELTCASRAVSWRCSLLTLASLLSGAGPVSSRACRSDLVCAEVLRMKH
jgi:hypothetical protein